MSKIHTLGDSHSINGFESIPEICIHWVGPWTMHRVGKEGLPKPKSLRYHMTKDDFLILCFGEIDCRCHVKKQIVNGRDENEILQTLADEYFKAIESNPIFGKYIVMSVIPPAYHNDEYDNKELPFEGTDEERYRFTEKLNRLLKQKCQDHNIIYLDVFSIYQDENGMLDPVLSDGTVHIKDCTLLRELLQIMRLL